MLADTHRRTNFDSMTLMNQCFLTLNLRSGFACLSFFITDVMQFYDQYAIGIC